MKFWGLNSTFRSLIARFLVTSFFFEWGLEGIGFLFVRALAGIGHWGVVRQVEPAKYEDNDWEDANDQKKDVDEGEPQHSQCDRASERENQPIDKHEQEISELVDSRKERINSKRTESFTRSSSWVWRSGRKKWRIFQCISSRTRRGVILRGQRSCRWGRSVRWSLFVWVPCSEKKEFLYYRNFNVRVRILERLGSRAMLLVLSWISFRFNFFLVFTKHSPNK